MILNYYRQLFPEGNFVFVKHPREFREYRETLTEPENYYNDMIILRPQKDSERELFLFSMGHEYCHPEKYFNQRLLKNRFMVHFIVGGSCYYNNQKLSEGDAFLLWPNKPHNLMCVKDDPMEMYWIDLSGTSLEKYIANIGFSTENLTFSYHFEEELKEIFDRALYRANPKCDTTEYYFGILKEVMSLCKHELKTQYKRFDSETVGQIEKMKQLMFEHQYQISAEQIAYKMGYSRKHISKIFKTNTGETLTAYKNRKRIELAQSMLQYERYSIQTISEQLGYCDEAAFSRAFKSALGVSPREYRSDFSSFTSKG